jgi:stringent starvation protein B
MPIDIYVPVGAVIGIYAQENGQGMVFEPQDDDETPPPAPPKGPKVVTGKVDKSSVNPVADIGKGKSKPSLRVIK